MEPEQIKALVKEIYHALSEKKAQDIRIIDIRDLTVVADYFLIASAGNPLQMAALQDAASMASSPSRSREKKILHGY